MEDDDIDTSSASSLLPVALSVLAIVLGAAGLYFGMTANQRLSPLTDSLEAGSSSAARLEKDIDALETRLAELSAQISESKKTLSRVRLYSNQNEQAVKQLASGMRENREEIVKLADRINELLSSGVPPAPQPTPQPSTASTSNRPAMPGSTEGFTGGSTNRSTGENSGGSADRYTTDRLATGSSYTIEAGDTLNKVASKLGVGLQALLHANSGIDPRRLRIGQEINVPAN